MVERRRIARTRIFAPAIVIPSQGSLLRDCSVRDITSLGARLEFAETPVLPTDFALTFDCARTLRRCRLVWRIANEVGVTFESLKPPKIQSLSRPTKPNAERMTNSLRQLRPAPPAVLLVDATVDK
jgi:hypothetical protein